MAIAILPGERLFLDTSFVVALAARADQHHSRAMELSQQIRAAGAHLVTTRAILLEVGNALSRLRYRSAAYRYLDSVEADPGHTILPLSDALWQTGLALYKSRHDKEWGLTDCVSFAAMAHDNISRALTADVHFEQAGFAALMRS